MKDHHDRFTKRSLAAKDGNSARFFETHKYELYEKYSLQHERGEELDIEDKTHRAKFPKDRPHRRPRRRKEVAHPF